MNQETPLAIVFDPIRSDLQRVEDLLRDAVGSTAEPLRGMLQHVLTGGKRLRAAVVVLSGQSLGGAGQTLAQLAAAVEILHAATLVHDDVVDESATRRGRDTLHFRWSTQAAVLAGDYLLAQSVRMVTELERGDILAVLARTLTAICEGEIVQALLGDGSRPGRTSYFKQIEAKTAALFRSAAEMAAMLAAGTDAQINALRRYGLRLGLAYQIVDDVLDIGGRPAELGKPVGMDLRQGLWTLPVLLHLQQAGPSDPVCAYVAGERTDDMLVQAIDCLFSSGALDAARAEAARQARLAQRAVRALPDTAARDGLLALAECVLTRRA